MTYGDYLTSSEMTRGILDTDKRHQEKHRQREKGARIHEDSSSGDHTADERTREYVF